MFFWNTVYISLRKNTERTWMKCAGDNYYCGARAD